LLSVQQGSNPEEMQRYIEKIATASKRMQKLIRDLLVFSRMENGSMAFEEVDLNEVIAGVLSDMEVEIEARGAEITVGSLPRLLANSSQMRQVFQNLVSNSMKFQRKDCQPKVSIYCDQSRTSLLDEPGTTCCIVVEDNGIGFHEKYADEIFVVFKRLHSFSEFEGSGVGLSICKKIIEAHGGKITAVGKQSQGAVFYIELPLQTPYLKKGNSKTNELSVE
jgi:light-regulated signal transduction histidine kinase (bacteriophytochrome)